MHKYNFFHFIIFKKIKKRQLSFMSWISLPLVFKCVLGWYNKYGAFQHEKWRCWVATIYLRCLKTLLMMKTHSIQLLTFILICSEGAVAVGRLLFVRRDWNFGEIKDELCITKIFWLEKCFSSIKQKTSLYGFQTKRF